MLSHLWLKLKNDKKMQILKRITQQIISISSRDPVHQMKCRHFQSSTKTLMSAKLSHLHISAFTYNYEFVDCIRLLKDSSLINILSISVANLK